MQFYVQFFITKDSNQRYGISVIAVNPAGTAQGQPAQIHDAVFSSEIEAAERLVSGLRGMFRTPVPGNFGRDFLFPTPELQKNW